MTMVRWVSARSVIAVLGLGGLALAQEGLIVDPWRHPSSAPLGDTTKKASGAGRTSARAASVAAPLGDATKATPRVVPVGPPLDLKTNPSAVVPVGPVLGGDLVDPWVRAASESADGEHRTRLSVARHDWAWEVQEIVDPWAKGPVAVARDPLIVDPWAR